MREDCNTFISLLSSSTSDFDSCMREDCNKPRVSGGGASFILIHACARIATGTVPAPPRALAGHFDSCMREDCNTTIVKHDGYARVLIHVCAKIATPLLGHRPYGSRCFDSCIREDCNGDLCYRKIAIFISIHACARIATVIGDSCRHSAPFRFMHARELQQQTSRRANYMSDFDSCMRKDCNREGELLPGVDCILIHACARIATAFDCCQRGIFVILIHACARIATRGLPGRGHPGDFDSCMREDCNSFCTTKIPTRTILIHACARIAISVPMWPRPVRQSF